MKIYTAKGFTAAIDDIINRGLQEPAFRNVKLAVERELFRIGVLGPVGFDRSWFVELVCELMGGAPTKYHYLEQKKREWLWEQYRAWTRSRPTHRAEPRLQ